MKRCHMTTSAGFKRAFCRPVEKTKPCRPTALWNAAPSATDDVSYRDPTRRLYELVHTAPKTTQLATPRALPDGFTRDVIPAPDVRSKVNWLTPALLRRCNPRLAVVKNEASMHTTIKAA